MPSVFCLTGSDHHERCSPEMPCPVVDTCLVPAGLSAGAGAAPGQGRSGRGECGLYQAFRSPRPGIRRQGLCQMSDTCPLKAGTRPGGMLCRYFCSHRKIAWKRSCRSWFPATLSQTQKTIFRNPFPADLELIVHREEGGILPLDLRTGQVWNDVDRKGGRRGPWSKPPCSSMPSRVVKISFNGRTLPEMPYKRLPPRSGGDRRNPAANVDPHGRELGAGERLTRKNCWSSSTGRSG